VLIKSKELDRQDMEGKSNESDKIKRSRDGCGGRCRAGFGCRDKDKKKLFKESG